MVRERAGHTLQPTALVHEAYLRLARETGTEWEDRAHFLAIAATAMRRVLVDHARARGAAKRGGGRTWVTLHEELAAQAEQSVDVLALDQALTRLSSIDERQGKVVELRFFGGLEIRETALLLKVSEGTVKRDWRHAKAWLRRELSA